MDPHSGEESIQVFIRIKPNSQQQGLLTYTETQIKLDKHQFAFDKIFLPSVTQPEIFHHVGNKLLNDLLEGYNSCVFVYGQTGSGKTHTMIGEKNGLMQQSFNQLFVKIDRIKNAQCLVTFSYFQLYNEQIFDLLEPKELKKLYIREDTKKGVFIENLSEKTALYSDKLIDALHTGIKNRHIGETQMNRESSRSHSIFTISLSFQMEWEGRKTIKTPKIHFVDLAGAQRQKNTQASGEKLKEASAINQSLTTLGMVINALTSEKPRSHIPYRDSKLTLFLRDSLGGNSKTIIIATVSNIASSFQETLSTLNFANRVKMVKIKALINQETFSQNYEVFKSEIHRLKTEILRLKEEQHRTLIKAIKHKFMDPPQRVNEFEQNFGDSIRLDYISDPLFNGITSPSLETLSSKINGKNLIGSIETMVDEENVKIIEESMEMCSPSEFIEQFEDLVSKQEKQIRGLQTDFNFSNLQKKDLHRKLEIYKENKFDSTEQLFNLRQTLINKEFQQKKQKDEFKKLKSQLLIFLNELKNFKIMLKDRQIQNKQLQNSLSQTENILQFRRTMIEDLNKKNLFIVNELQKSKENIQEITSKNINLHEENQLNKHIIQEETLKFNQQIQEKSIQLKQAQITNQRLTHDLSVVSNQLLAEKEAKQCQFHKNIKTISELKRLLNEKESQMMKNLTETHLLQDLVQKIKSQHLTTIQNYVIKYEAKMIEYDIFKDKLKQDKKEAEIQIDQLKKKIEANHSQIQTLSSQNQKMTHQNKKFQSKLTDADKKLSQIQHIYEQNEQLKKSYKQIVKQNYRSKGKYQNVNKNEELDKQKNDELLSKVQFYEEKFKLMSIEYHQVQGIVKKLKQKELQANKKIQFYEENIKLMQMEKFNEDSDEKNQLIRELKEENRELKYNMENMIQSTSEKQTSGDNGNKRSRQERQNLSLSMKYEKFRGKLANLMKNWQGFASKSQQQIPTSQMIDLCEVMLNQNGIKFETIAKGIRRQQKLKSQNHFILKENIYLNERLEELENRQEPDVKSEARPRKVIKLE